MHTVVTSAIAPTDDDSQLGDVCARDGADHLRAVLSNTTLLRLRANHVSCDVHKEQERDLPLRAQLDEVRRFQRGLGEEDAVVRNYADRVAVDMCEAL